MAEMNKKGRCWKGYKPKPGSTAYSRGSCIPEENSVEQAESDDFGSKPIVGNPVLPQGNHLTRIKKKGQNNNTQGQNNNTQGQNDQQQAKPENTNGNKKVEEVKVTPTPAERMNNPQARANKRVNRAATLSGKISARMKSREDYPEGSPLHTGGSSEVDAGRMSKLNKIK